MGLLDCVSDNSDKYPVSHKTVAAQAPLERGLRMRRSMGLFASNASLKGKDIDFWRNRLLFFLFKGEGREDVTVLRIPLKQMGYATIGDFIREIPQHMYAPFQAHPEPDTGLRKDYKLIWERNGIAEPAILKWEGMIEGQRCMGLQLDRKKAVPFGIHDGKGLFYCKKGHRALVPVEEVYPYKSFLRQFLGMPPRKDSMPLNLLPGRSSVRVAVAKKYKLGDRVHLPTEGKWATILWTGRIDGEWVVDLVYDAERPEGKPVSPDEPCMSRSLSMGEFIDEVIPEEGTYRNQSLSSLSPPTHVPPPPPSSSPPTPRPPTTILINTTEIELEDEVFKEPEEPPESSEDESEEVYTEGEENGGGSEFGEDVSEIHSTIETLEDERLEVIIQRTLSEPKMDGKKQQQQPRLQPKSTHKPLFNLSAIGKKKQSEGAVEVEEESPRPKPSPRQVVAQAQSQQQPPKSGFSFFSTRSSGKTQGNKTAAATTTTTANATAAASFFRRDRSKSPVSKRPEKKRVWSDEHREAPIDVPDSPKIVEAEEKAKDIEQQSATSPTAPKEAVGVSTKGQVPGSVSEDSFSDTTPPYSPKIKDVGFRMGSGSPQKKKSGGFGGFFSGKKKAVPTRDYLEEDTTAATATATPQPPIRHSSIGMDDRWSSGAPSNATDSGAPPAPPTPTPTEDMKTSHVPEKGFDFLNRTPKAVTILGPKPYVNPNTYSSPPPAAAATTSTTVEVMEDDEFVLESLEDDQFQPEFPRSPTQTQQHQQQAFMESSSGKQKRGSKGKGFSFGFSKSKSKPSASATHVESGSVEGSDEILIIVDDSPPKTKDKRGSFRNSLKRTFSKERSKQEGASSLKRQDSLGRNSNVRRSSLTYLDNNDALNVSLSKSKSASALVDIQPWEERRGQRKDIFEDSPTEEEPKGAGAPAQNTSSAPPPASPTKVLPVPLALLPKDPDPSIPKHRIFTTPKIFGFGQKSAEATAPKKDSIRATSTAIKPPRAALPYTKPSSSDVLSPRSPPPSESPPPPPQSPYSPPLNSPNKLKSALRQRKEIEAIPKGIKIGERVIWYNGRIPIPGSILKLYKDGTDKYTAVVKFDRMPYVLYPLEPLTLAREGDDYVITVEELLTPEILGLPALTTLSGSPNPHTSSASFVEAATRDGIANDAADEDLKSSPTVRFVPAASSSPAIQVTLEEDRVPPPIQEEEAAFACGGNRGLPSRDEKSSLQSILFSMFYTTNAFDTSLLYGCGNNSPEADLLTRKIRELLRDGIVCPLRRSGYCEYEAVQQFIELVGKSCVDFDPLNCDAEIMTFILFERALKLGKFISYSNGLTDYLHQLVVDPKDLSKVGILQQLFEASLEQMDNVKLKTAPSPALILEIPRANDRTLHFDAVIPNLTINVSHLLENGPRLCICGMVANHECLKCSEKSGTKALVYCDNCTAMSEQIHFQLAHPSSLVPMTQSSYSMDLVGVVCVKGGSYSAFVKCGRERSSPWLYYDPSKYDNPKVSLEMNLGMWINRLEKYPGEYTKAFVHPLLTHFLANSHICIYQPREKSSLV